MHPALGSDTGSAVVSYGPAAGVEASENSPRNCRGYAGGGAEVNDAGRFKEARAVFEQVALAGDFVVFVTLPACRLMD